MSYSPKERFLKTLRGEAADGLCVGWEGIAIIRDPAAGMDRGVREMGKTTQDCFGTTLVWPEGTPGAMPHVTDENKVIKDICNWREELKVPSFSGADLNWEPVLQQVAGMDRDNVLTASIMTGGLFERLHFLMGFEETLINLLLETEEIHALLDVLVDARIDLFKTLIAHCKPDVVVHHDDWGNKKSLFMNTALWQELFKERYAKLYGYLRENDILVIHHADCHCAAIVDDMAEIGVNVWQGVIPDNDIPALQKQLNGRMVLMGGIDSAIDRADATEEEIRKETRRACETYGPAGGFIPSMTYGSPGSIYPHVQETVYDEIRRYNADTYGK